MKNYYLLLMLASASVSSQPLTVVQAHWQEGMAVGVTELSGTLYIRDTAAVAARPAGDEPAGGHGE